MATTQRVSLARFGVSPQVENIVLWRDVKQTGALLAGVTLAYYFLQTTNLVTLSLYTLASVVAGGLVWQQGGNMLGRPGPRVPAILEGFSEESWARLTSSIRPHINLVLNYLGAVVSGKDVLLSLKVLGASLAAAYILSHVSLLTLAYTAVVLALTLPKGYEARKDDCDKVLDRAAFEIKKGWAKLDDLFFRKISPSKPAVKTD